MADEGGRAATVAAVSLPPVLSAASRALLSCRVRCCLSWSSLYCVTPHTRKVASMLPLKESEEQVEKVLNVLDV
jgi:hypothetical protein